jgi:hypothetical protein
VTATITLSIGNCPEAQTRTNGGGLTIKGAELMALKRRITAVKNERVIDASSSDRRCGAEVIAADLEPIGMVSPHVSFLIWPLILNEIRSIPPEIDPLGLLHLLGQRLHRLGPLLDDIRADGIGLLGHLHPCAWLFSNNKFAPIPTSANQFK